MNDYLNEYAKDFGLNDFISYGCEVTQLIVEQDDAMDTSAKEDEDKDNKDWPKITLRWEETRENGQCFEETFDAVCVCNGHFASPSAPDIPGLELFAGRVMHSIEYNDPTEFAGLTVLCVGARASGADLAREISHCADQVYLSDSTCPPLEDGQPLAVGNLMQMPRTMSVDSESKIHFGGGCKISPGDVDVIILCSGYDYRFPFINSASNLELRCVPGERRVSPLYEHLWHAVSPSIAFVGLQHSILPFPHFEIQARALVSQLCGTASEPLPGITERLAAARKDTGGPNAGRVQDTHYLGSFQWDYWRRLLKTAGEYNKDAENFITTNKVSAVESLDLANIEAWFLIF